MTGHPGEGKSAMAANLALEGGLKKENCVKLECARDWEDVNWSLRCFTIVIIDDIFGGFCLDHERLSEWKNVLGDIEQRAKNGELKVIITSRHYIIEEAIENIDKVTMFNKDAELSVHLNSRYLKAKELRQILQSTLERNHIKKNIGFLNACVFNAIGKYNTQTGEREQFVSGFPECAALFATKEEFICRGPDFFLRPEFHFKEYIEQLYKSRDTEQFYKFIALVAVWAKENHTIKDTDLQNPKSVSPHIQNIAECFGIAIDHNFLETLKHSFKAYTSYLLMYNSSSGEYTFTHNLINEMVGVVLGNHKPRECIKLCQREFLMERLTFSEIEKSEMKVSIPPLMYTDLCDKFIKFICPDDCNDIQDRLIFKHTLFESKRFVKVFLQYIVQNHFEPKLFNTPCWAKWNVEQAVTTKLYLMDYIIANNLFVLAEQILMNITKFLFSDTQVSGDSICIIMRKRPSWMKPLFESGRAHPNSQCLTWCGGTYPLIEGSRENLIDSVRQLLYYGADPNVANFNGETALHLAAEGGHYEICRELLSFEDDVNVVNNMGKNISRDDTDSASESRSSDVTDTPSINKSQANSKDINGETPLHRAASKGFINVIKTLLNNGADINILAKKNQTYLHDTVVFQSGEVEEPLIKIKREDVFAKGGFEKSPLHCAALEGHKDALQMLLNNGANVNIVDNKKNTALHYAASRGHCSVIEELLGSKANVNVKGSLGKTPLHWTAVNGHKDAMKMLLNNGADVISKDDKNQTVLHFAVDGGHCDVIEELLKSKAIINVKDINGQTPLHLAAAKGQTTVTKLLLKNGADVNVGDVNNQTALCFAASGGHCGVIKELLNSKANIDAKDSDQNTPLQWASFNGHIIAVQILLNKGADVNSVNDKNQTALHAVALGGGCGGLIEELPNDKADVNPEDIISQITLHSAGIHKYAAKMLLKKGADVNILDFQRLTALHYAAKVGHCGVIEELLNNKSDVNAKDSNGRTPLHGAVFNGHKKAAKMLLNNGAEVNIVDDNKQTALYDAATKGYCCVIEELLNNKADVNVVDSFGNTPLHFAALKGHHDAVKMLLNNGADGYIVDRNNGTALHFAAGGGNCDVIEEFINDKADVNAKASDGDTPVHIAAFQGHRDAVEMLLKNGADVNIVNDRNQTAIFDAAKGGDCGVIEELINNKADVNFRDDLGKSPLHWATIKGQKDAIKMLLNNGADVQCPDTSSQTVLHSAAANGYCYVIKELLNCKADCNAMNSDGKTPLHLAACNGFNDAVKLLLNNGADVNAMDKENCTALYESVANGKHDVITELINFKADVNLKDSVGDSPLHIARRLKDAEAVEILINNGAYV